MQLEENKHSILAYDTSEMKVEIVFFFCAEETLQKWVNE